MHLAGLLQPFPILEWKWEVVTIDFITKFPRTTKHHDSIMAVMDKLTKTAHFILVKTTHKEANIAEIYMKKIAKLHNVSKAMVLDRDPQFTSNFWKELFKGFGINLNFSTTYHLEMNGKTKMTN
jgi:hypothetical protein